MGWKEILGLILIGAIVLVPLWPRRAKRTKPGGPDRYDRSAHGADAGGQDTGFGHGGGHDGD